MLIHFFLESGSPFNSFLVLDSEHEKSIIPHQPLTSSKFSQKSSFVGRTWLRSICLPGCSRNRFDWDFTINWGMGMGRGEAFKASTISNPTTTFTVIVVARLHSNSYQSTTSRSSCVSSHICASQVPTTPARMAITKLDNFLYTSCPAAGIALLSQSSELRSRRSPTIFPPQAISGPTLHTAADEPANWRESRHRGAREPAHKRRRSHKQESRSPHRVMTMTHTNTKTKTKTRAKTDTKIKCFKGTQEPQARERLLSSSSPSPPAPLSPRPPPITGHWMLDS